MTTNDTLAAGSFNLLLYTAQQCGANPEALMQAVGVDPAQLKNPDGRIPIRQIQALWREAIAATGDSYLSLHMGTIINPVSVGILAYVMMHCPTLEKAFEKLCQYQDIVCEGIITTGRRVGDAFQLSLRITSQDIIFPEHALNSEVSIYLSAMRALTGQTVTAREIRFAYPRPIDTAEHEKVLSPAKLTFDAPETVLVLDPKWLDTPVLNANPNLFPLFERHADELLEKLRTPTLTARVKQEIVALLKGEEPTLGVVADRLAMGVRTLQLHLKDEGVTYQQLLDEVRRDLAVKHLREPYLSTTDIAYLLGYSEPSVFFRSFKKWTGSTPGAFRQQTFLQSA
ncbi:AraC family transcriptional regulator [Nibrella viscosa]|uniref:AraC family transcriptional regulator n=1 Tax=Nibrella viscosa TaxID=1084524 RepID=A0ABP8JT99_9BACT